MMRFSVKELSIGRIINAFTRRFLDFPHALAWDFPSRKTKKMKERLDYFSNLHLGQRCFIIGNGPSIAGMDLSSLKNEITFGLNRIYLVFDKLPFRPTYYVCVNELVLEQFAPEINALEITKFLNWNSRKYFNLESNSINFMKLAFSLQDGFTTYLRSSFFSGGTVTYIALQLAYIMGFSEVILIGVDHSFVDKGTPNKVQVRLNAPDLNHFHPDYFPSGIKWQLPDLRRSELAYEVARQKYEESGRKIFDATVNGQCPVFEKRDFESLF